MQVRCVRIIQITPQRKRLPVLLSGHCMFRAIATAIPIHTVLFTEHLGDVACDDVDDGQYSTLNVGESSGRVCRRS